MLLDVPGTSPETILLYGHCDKQPEMVGWGDGLGPWTPGPPRRQALRPRRAGRRLRRLLRPHRDRGRAARGRAARALPGADRGERGEREPRPARVHGIPRRAHRRARPRDLPRLRLRQLRPALGHDVAAGHHQRRAHGGGADRGRALRRGRAASCRRASASRASSCRASRTSGPARGRADFHVEIPPARAAEARAVSGPCWAGTSPGASRWSTGMRYAQEDPVDLLAGRDVEAGAVDHRRGRASRAGRRRQRAAAADLAQALAAHPAHPRRRPRRSAPARRSSRPIRRTAPGCASRAPRRRPAGMRLPREPWLLDGRARCVAAPFRPARDVQGPRRIHPVHGHARASASRGRSSSSRARAGRARTRTGPNEFLHVPFAERLTACVADLIAAHYRARTR